MLPGLSTLRRCRALLALTVLAWTWLGLGMQAVALAPPADCCAGMAMAMGASASSMGHEASSGHADGMTAANCPCAHSAASVPLLVALNLATPLLATRPMPMAAGPAPQPARVPLLRPPLHSSYVAMQHA